MGQAINLDTKLLKLSQSDFLTVRDACQGILALGGVGSGKTSASGKAIATAYLRAGMGGLVLCAKPEEVALWKRYCSETNRSASLIVFDGKVPGYNFIAAELARHGTAGLNNVVEILMRALDMARASSPSGARAGEAFWEDTTRQILRNSIEILYAATGTVRITDLLAFVRSAPISTEQMTDPGWQRSSRFFTLFGQAAATLDDAVGARCSAYWQADYARLDPKTRGNILISLTTTLDRFNHGWLHQAFCSETTIVPELSFHGAVILMAFPALTHNEDGVLAQMLFKFLWQRAALNRNGLAPAQQERPIFLFADEAHTFLLPSDAEFLSTCRGSRVCAVFLSQNLPTFYAKMGGENARDRVDHLIGNFATRIWHNNSCSVTNEAAARTIGRSLQRRGTFSETEGTNTSVGMNMGDGTNWGTNSGSGGSFTYNSGNGNGGSWSVGASSNSGRSQGGSDNRGRNRGSGTSEGTSRGYSEQMDHLVEPATFSRALKTGGPAKRNRVSAVWYQAGRQFVASAGNTLLAEFQQ